MGADVVELDERLLERLCDAAGGEDRGEHEHVDARRVGAVVPVEEREEVVPRATEVRGVGVLHVGAADLRVVALRVLEERRLRRKAEARRLERVVGDRRDGGAERLARAVGRIFMTALVTRRGVFVAFGVKVLSRGFPVKLSDTSVRISSLAVSVAMRLCAALRSVSAVHFSSAVSFWIAFDETSSAERFVVENCDGSAYWELENETLQRPVRPTTSSLMGSVAERHSSWTVSACEGTTRVVWLDATMRTIASTADGLASLALSCGFSFSFNFKFMLLSFDLEAKPFSIKNREPIEGN